MVEPIHLPADLRVIVRGIQELGLTLEAPFEEAPLDLVLTNNGSHTVVVYMLLYEGILRDDYTGDYTGHLRDGNIFDRKRTGGHFIALSQRDPAKRAALIAASEDVIAPRTRWLFGLEGGMQRIERETTSIGQIMREPTMIHDLANYRQMNILLSVALDDGQFYGPQSADLRAETEQLIEWMRRDMEHDGDESVEESYNRLYESQLGGFHATIQLIPGPDRLKTEDERMWKRFGLTAEDLARLQSLGLSGTLKVRGCGSSGHAPHRSRTLIVGRRQMREPVDLPQPDDCEVIYYQDGDEWKKFPPDAPVLKKRFRLKPDPENENRTLMWAEAYEGSDAGGGGGAFMWEEPSAARAARSGAEAKGSCRLQEEGNGIETSFQFITRDGKPPEPPRPRADLRLRVAGVDEHGLRLELAYGTQYPVDVVLTNDSGYYLMSFLLGYECILRDGISEPEKASYGRELRDGNVIRRWWLWSPLPLLQQFPPADQVKHLRLVRPSVAPGTKWLVGFGRDLSQIEQGAIPPLEQKENPYASTFHDIGQYKQISITLDAMLESGEIVGPHPDVLREKLEEQIEEFKGRSSSRL